MEDELRFGKDGRVIARYIGGDRFVEIQTRPSYDIDTDWLNADDCRRLIDWLESAIAVSEQTD